VRLASKSYLPIMNDNAARTRSLPAGAMAPARRAWRVERNESPTRRASFAHVAAKALPAGSVAIRVPTGAGQGRPAPMVRRPEGGDDLPTVAVADISVGRLKASASGRPLRRCLPS
jgi:hypothetical protein